jgi:hypothetical protein
MTVNREKSGKFVSANPFKRETSRIDKENGNKKKADNNGYYEQPNDGSEFAVYDFETGESY